MIILSMDHKKCIGWHEDKNGELIDEIDDNQIEISYREDDEHGVGIDGSEYIQPFLIGNTINPWENFQIPIFALSANVFEEDAKRCISVGMEGYISKLIDRKERQQIRQVIETHCR